MGKRPFWIIFFAVFFAACSNASQIVGNDAPRLLEDVTLPPTTPTVTRVLSATPTPAPPQASTPTPLQVVTIQSANVVLITPTLPPSKTPTNTPTPLPTATNTPPATATSFVIIATSGFSSSAFIVSTPTPVGFTGVGGGFGGGAVDTAVIAPTCAVAWFFTQPILPNCPAGAASTSPASYQQFQNGFMFWVGQLDAIYVLYSDGGQPRWQVFQDNFADGMAESDPAYDNAPAGTWQPRRGFGKVWREQSGVRERLGWALMEGEAGYSAQLQVGDDGAVFLNDPRGLIYRLQSSGTDWTRYGG